MKKQKQIHEKLDLGENKKYDDAVEELTLKFSPELGKKVGNLFMELHLQDQHMNVDTYMASMRDIFILLSQRNKGISQKDDAFIGEQDILELVQRYPRILSQTVLEKVNQNLTVLDNLSCMDTQKVNRLVKQSKGYIFSIGANKLNETCLFLDNIFVIDELGRKRNAAEYMLNDLGEKNLQVSTKKIYARLMHICTTSQTNVLLKKAFDFCYKRNEEEYENKYHISQEQLENEYVLPSTENIEIYKQKIKESIDRIIHPIYGEQNEGKGEL